MKKVILLFFISLLYTTLYSATEFVSTILEDGSGDYSFVFAWNAAIACDLVHSTGTRVFSHSGIQGTLSDGVTVWGDISKSTGVVVHATATQVLIKNIDGVFDQIEQIYAVYNTNYVTVTDTGNAASAVAKIDGMWSNPGPDLIRIRNWTTSRENYVKIYTTYQARHKGIWDTTKYRISINAPWSGVLELFSTAIILDGIQIENTAVSVATWTGGYGIRDYYGFETNTTSYYYDSDYTHGEPCYREISNCYTRYGGTTPVIGYGTAGYLPAIGGQTTGYFKLWNNVFQGWAPSMRAGWISNHSTMVFYNNTCIANSTTTELISIGGSGSVFYLKNNIVIGATTCFDIGAVSAGTYSNNLSFDATSPNAAYRNLMPIFVNKTLGYDANFQLVYTDTSAYKNGENLTNDPILPFTRCIMYNMRPPLWSIGAFDIKEIKRQKNGAIWTIK